MANAVPDPDHHYLALGLKSVRKIISIFLLLIAVLSCNSPAVVSADTALIKADDSSAKTANASITTAIKSDTAADHLQTYPLPRSITGYFNDDNLLDSATLMQEPGSSHVVLHITHTGTGESVWIKTSADVAGKADFKSLNWVGKQFEAVKKGSKIFDNISAEGDIIGADEVPENKKITLLTDGILLHVDEACGGGILYYKKGKYHWVIQE